VVFVTLEDEFGIANLVVWPSVFETYRRIVMGARMMGVRGTVQREGLVIHLVVEQLWDWSADLDRIANLDGRFELRAGRGDQARSSTPDPRDGPQAGYDRDRVVLERPTIKIASRDFH
jgi:error-prone DNA polymerase